MENKKLIIHFFIKLTIVCSVTTAIFTLIFGVLFCKGEGMYPRIRDGDVAIYYRLVRDYQAGDVVVFNNSGTNVAARIVAQSGDVIDLNQDGQLIVNGNVQQEEVFFPTESIPGGITYPYKIGEKQYFLLCDNRPSASDSRFFGAVSQKEIKGKVINLFRRRGI